jgi:hypothetical protein
MANPNDLEFLVESAELEYIGEDGQEVYDNKKRKNIVPQVSYRLALEGKPYSSMRIPEAMFGRKFNIGDKVKFALAANTAGGKTYTVESE